MGAPGKNRETGEMYYYSVRDNNVTFVGNSSNREIGSAGKHRLLYCTLCSQSYNEHIAKEREGESDEGVNAIPCSLYNSL